MANKILTVSELAQHLNVHRITIYRLLKSGSLPGFKIGRVWRFDLDEISNWMASGKSGKDIIASDGVASDGKLDGKMDGKADGDGDSRRDGNQKSARAQSRTQPPPRPSAQDPRGGAPRR